MLVEVEFEGTGHVEGRSFRIENWEGDSFEAHMAEDGALTVSTYAGGNDEVIFRLDPDQVKTFKRLFTVTPSDAGLYDLLSKREKQILALMVVGGTNKSMAKNFGISARTVEVHVSHIRDKTKMTRFETIRWASRLLNA